MENLIIIGNFNFCPSRQMPIIGVECLQCEYMKKVDEEYFCTCEDSRLNEDGISIKEFINILLDLLAAGEIIVEREKILKIIEDL
ncbi:MAG: hypothetical protein ABFD08_00595 [Syntrophomonas sp.]